MIYLMKDTFQQQLDSLEKVFDVNILEPSIQKAFVGYKEALLQTQETFNKVRETDFVIKSKLDREKNQMHLNQQHSENIN